MGLMSFIKSELIDVIEWTDDSSTEKMVWRFPDKDKEIKNGAQLTVRESQVAVFVSEGQIADVFQPGRYELTTQNIPLLTTLKSWKYGFESPFKAEVYFVNTKQFTDQKWGTTNPIMMRDAEFGMLRLRGFGIYSFRVDDPVVFLKEVFGTNQTFDTENITGQLKRSILSGLTDILGESKIPALDLASQYDEIGELAKTKLQDRFSTLGFKLVSFFVENISLPEEVEKVLDKRTSMGILGDMNQYAQYQAAEALRDAAQNEGGGFAGAGVGLGAGAAMGNMFGNMFTQQQQQTQTQQTQPAQTTPTEACSKCGAQVKQGIKFCPECGNSMAPPTQACVKCGAAINQGAKFCPECGSKQQLACAKCGAEISATTKFCPECGTKTES
jgi:membrane protease subunit (stomatin/prohibitin family)